MLSNAIQTGSLAPLKLKLIAPTDTVASPKALQFTEAIHSALVAGQSCYLIFFFFCCHVSQGYLEISSRKSDLS